MTQPTFLICMGATKAGTSWLYRTLADRSDCALRAVKESHYWDTTSAQSEARQRAAFEARLFGLQVARDAARADERWRKAQNMARQIDDLRQLETVLSGNRVGHAAYLDYVFGNAAADTGLVADICPAYALLRTEVIVEMAALPHLPKFLYLLRDPVARLWSAVRMQAERKRGPHETLEEKANNTLWRILNKNQETHITARGRYSEAIGKLRDAVPKDRLLVMYMEDLHRQEGYDRLCAFLALRSQELPIERRVHEGAAAEMRPNLRAGALRFLADEYDFAAREVGALPDAWKRSMSELT